jgi:hypothetical protein
VTETLLKKYFDNVEFGLNSIPRVTILFLPIYILRFIFFSSDFERTKMAQRGFDQEQGVQSMLLNVITLGQMVTDNIN